jgi:hypothetical protein
MSYVCLNSLGISFANNPVKGQFLPWHRYYMHIYETLLRDECGYTGFIP